MHTNDLVSFTNALGGALCGKQVRNIYQTLITNNDAYYDANFDTFPRSKFIGRVSENVNRPCHAVYIVQIHGREFLYVIDVYAYFRNVPPKTMNAVGFYFLSAVVIPVSILTSMLYVNLLK